MTGRDVVIVEAVRTPVGRRNGGLSTVHPVDLLGATQAAVVARSGIDPTAIDQVVGGCVDQVGEQAFNVTRTAWLSAGLPLNVAATSVDAQCGSSQQATNLGRDVTTLRALGVLTSRQADGLLAKLNLQGNNGDAGRVGAFINNVNGLFNDGVLTRAEADALLWAANVLLLSVTNSGR